MKKNYLIILFMSLFFSCLVCSKAKASTPLWTFVPVAAFPSNITLDSAKTATIQYCLY